MHYFITTNLCVSNKSDVLFCCRCRFDIPVLHIDDVYWTKHRLTVEDAITGIKETREGRFAKRQGEPDASRFEHKS